jgi:hypothetical protein
METDAEIIGQAYCDECAQRVNVIYGPCHCEPGCGMQTTVCELCGVGLSVGECSCLAYLPCG